MHIMRQGRDENLAFTCLSVHNLARFGKGVNGFTLHITQVMEVTLQQGKTNAQVTVEKIEKWDAELSTFYCTSFLARGAKWTLFTEK